MKNEYRIHAYAQTEGLKVNTQVSDQIALKKAQMLDEALAHDFVIQLEAKLNTAYREVLSNHTQRLRSLYRESINHSRQSLMSTVKERELEIGRLPELTCDTSWLQEESENTVGFLEGYSKMGDISINPDRDAIEDLGF